MTKREIYLLVFNKWIDKEQGLRGMRYEIGKMSLDTLRTPKSITLKDEKITVLFTDNTRHIINYTSDVELFDRFIEPKEKKDPTDKSEKK
jgi:hypothetical protein